MEGLVFIVFFGAIIGVLCGTAAAGAWWAIDAILGVSTLTPDAAAGCIILGAIAVPVALTLCFLVVLLRDGG